MQILRRLFLSAFVESPWNTSGIPAIFRLSRQKNPPQSSHGYFGIALLGEMEHRRTVPLCVFREQSIVTFNNISWETIRPFVFKSSRYSTISHLPFLYKKIMLQMRIESFRFIHPCFTELNYFVYADIRMPVSVSFRTFPLVINGFFRTKRAKRICLIVQTNKPIILTGIYSVNNGKESRDG